MSRAHDELLEELRQPTFAIAYRMLGSVGEAEDVVQETLLRLHDALESGEEIASPRAYTATIATRLAIDELRSAKRRREAYVGDWLPEPLVTADEDDPAHHAETADALSIAFLALLEKLTPEQRAAFLLHDVFDYGYGEVARILGTKEDNARQLASRARRHVGDRRPRFRSSEEEQAELARRFFAAAREGDLAGLEQLLAPDVTLTGDGGGKAPALARALRGRSRVARTLRNWARFAAKTGAWLDETEINGAPGAIARAADGSIISVMALEIEDGQITAITGVVNPDKLAHLA